MSGHDQDRSLSGSGDDTVSWPKASQGRDRAKILFGVAFLASLVFYVMSYTVIELWRSRKGPWEVTFVATSENCWIEINQHRLGITNMQVVFPPVSRGISDPSQTASNSGILLKKVLFSEARPVPFELPLGKCVFLDTTFLPGTVTMQILGHEIELLPRTLIVDHRECTWTPMGGIVTLKSN